MRGSGGGGGGGGEGGREREVVGEGGERERERRVGVYTVILYSMKWCLSKLVTLTSHN